MPHVLATVLALLPLASGAPTARRYESVSDTMHNNVAADNSSNCRVDTPPSKALLQVSATFDSRGASITESPTPEVFLLPVAPDKGALDKGALDKVALDNAALVKAFEKAGQKCALDKAAVKTVPLTAAGYNQVKAACCITSMIEFIRRVITEGHQRAICDEGALAGLALWHYCNDDRGSTQDFASLLAHFTGSLPLPSGTTCPWITWPPSACPALFADPNRYCQGYASATLPPCLVGGTTTSTTTVVACPAGLSDSQFFGLLSTTSLVTKGDATVAAHNIYTAIAIQGTFNDGSPFDSGTVDGIAYIGDGSATAADYPTWNFNAQPDPIKAFAAANINFAQLEGFVHHPDLQNFTQGDFTVIVSSRGGTFSLDDVGGSFDASGNYIADPDAQGENNGKTLVIFTTANDITLTKSPTNSRQFGPSVFAPFAKVDLRGDAGFIDGCVVARTFVNNGANAGQLQLHGDCYTGPLCPSSVPVY